MKSIFVFAILTACMVVFEGCNNSSKQSQENSTAQESVEHENNSKSVDEISDSQAQAIINAYLELKDGLVQTDSDIAIDAATKIVNAIKDNRAEQAQNVLKEATNIAETGDVILQREHFNTLSENVYALVKATGANDITLYRQHCPMAFKNTGAYWLSAEKEVNNPYFGDQMLHCGSTKETLEQKNL